MTKQVEIIEAVETQEEKGEAIMTEQVEIEKIEKGTMYTINREMVVVETTEDFSNPLSYDKDALEMFLKNNRETLEDYFNDENNHGIAFHECGFSGKAQDEFVQSWKDEGVRVF